MSKARCAFVRISIGTLSEIFPTDFPRINEVIPIVAENNEKTIILSLLNYTVRYITLVNYYYCDC